MMPTIFKPRHSLLFLVVFAFANFVKADSKDDCKPDALTTSASRHLTALEKSTGVLEKLTDEKNKKIFATLTSISKHAVSVCKSLPVIGAGFAVLGAMFDIFETKPQEDKLQCSMKKEFDKINAHLQKIEQKVDQLSKKMDKVIDMLDNQVKRDIQAAYNQYYKEPIRKNYVSYMAFADNMDYHHQRLFDFSCRDDQAIQALDWLDRTVRKDDPTNVNLTDHIFGTSEAPNCDHDSVMTWFDSIFSHASVAAAMHVQCYATTIQVVHREACRCDANTKDKKLTMDDAVKIPEFKTYADKMKMKIDAIKREFKKYERKRQELCFEKTMREMRKNKVLEDHQECTCNANRKTCTTALDVIRSTFDQFDVTICTVGQFNKKDHRYQNIQFFSEGAEFMLPLGLEEATEKCAAVPQPLWTISLNTKRDCKDKDWASSLGQFANKLRPDDCKCFNEPNEISS